MHQRPVHRADRLFNGRVLLEFAGQEIAAADLVDTNELEAAIRATGDVFRALCGASRTLGVAPPDLPESEPWAQRLRETRLRSSPPVTRTD